MNESDLIKQFNDIPMTRFFRQLNRIMHIYIDQIKHVLPDSPENIDREALKPFSTLLDTFKAI